MIILYMPVFKVQEEVFLNKINKCYVKILTVNKKPDNSPLKEYIKELPRQRLSQFDYDCKTRAHCLFAFINPESGDFIQSDEIEVAMDLLINSNYTVDYKLTKMVKKNSEKLVFYFS
jgi:hypothetical protein